jgi:hypothetical protein
MARLLVMRARSNLTLLQLDVQQRSSPGPHFNAVSFFLLRRGG